MKLDKQKALDLIEYIASEEGTNRSRMVKGKMVGDEAINQVYEIVHSTGECEHDDWVEKWDKIWGELKGKAF